MRLGYQDRNAFYSQPLANDLGVSETKRQIGNYEGTGNFSSRNGAWVSKARAKEAAAEEVEALTRAMAMQPQKAVRERTAPCKSARKTRLELMQVLNS